MNSLRVCLGSSLRSLGSMLRTGSDVLLLPELLNGGYAALRRGDHSMSRTDPVINRLRMMAGPRYLIAGSLFLEGRNSSLVFHRGRLVHRYDKIHLFRPAGDHLFFRGGNRISTFMIRMGSVRIKAGIVICYDLRFPELIRLMTRKGMRVLFVPARWPASRDDAWRSLLKARAIENQSFVIGCNARGKEGGHSYAFGPMGNELYSSRQYPGPHVVELPLDDLKRARRFSNYVKEARLLGRVGGNLRR